MVSVTTREEQRAYSAVCNVAILRHFDAHIKALDFGEELARAEAEARRLLASTNIDHLDCPRWCCLEGDTRAPAHVEPIRYVPTENGPMPMWHLTEEDCYVVHLVIEQEVVILEMQSWDVPPSTMSSALDDFEAVRDSLQRSHAMDITLVVNAGYELTYELSVETRLALIAAGTPPTPARIITITCPPEETDYESPYHVNLRPLIVEILTGIPPERQGFIRVFNPLV